MKLIRYTLLADGSSDEVLLPIIDWLLAQHCQGAAIVGSFARNIGKIGHALDARVEAAVHHYPCDVLFVHRDCEAMPHSERIAEIEEATAEQRVPIVPVAPKRMTEAWLFSDEDSIRFASGNQSGRISLNVPAKRTWESLPDPKAILLEALCVASEKSGRALKKFRPEGARHLIASRSENFAQLRGLGSFDAFEASLVEVLRDLDINDALD